MIVHGIAVPIPVFLTLLISTYVPANLPGYTSFSPPAPKQPLHPVELSQAWGGVGGPALAEPQPQGGNLWHTGNATNYFLGKKKSLCFPLFSSAGSSRTLTTSDCQLQGTLSTGKLLCILYGWRCIFFCYSILCSLICIKIKDCPSFGADYDGFISA